MPTDPDGDGTGSAAPRLILLRHGEVASHRGDMPLTDVGRRQAEEMGRRLRAVAGGTIHLLCGATIRARETAQRILHEIASGEPHIHATGPTTTWALRNPDLYLAGQRVDMVSTPAAFAEQVVGVNEDDIVAIPFYAGFLTSPDRIGWWLDHADPPGDDAASVAFRIARFASSLRYPPRQVPTMYVGITHSPVLRAIGLQVTGQDPGEPDHLEGYSLRIGNDGALRGQVVNAADPFARSAGPAL